MFWAQSIMLTEQMVLLYFELVLKKKTKLLFKLALVTQWEQQKLPNWCKYFTICLLKLIFKRFARLLLLLEPYFIFIDMLKDKSYYSGLKGVTFINATIHLVFQKGKTIKFCLICTITKVNRNLLKSMLTVWTVLKAHMNALWNICH